MPKIKNATLVSADQLEKGMMHTSKASQKPKKY